MSEYITRNLPITIPKSQEETIYTVHLYIDDETFKETKTQDKKRNLTKWDDSILFNI